MINKEYNVVVVGMGYVGLSIAVMLAKKNCVTVVDTNIEKVNKINALESPIGDELIEKYLKKERLNLKATNNEKYIYTNADYIIIAVSTDYDEQKNFFNCSIIENIIDDIVSQHSKAIIVIKSTVPIGFTGRMSRKYPDHIFLFSPEFLRETKALYDNLFPSRIVIGTNPSIDKCIETAKQFELILKESIEKTDVESFVISYDEAESVKLFANAYLAMRISFFNEIDTFAEIKNMNPKHIIDALCSDFRIGNHYNNPSFGYGGYCLPKDTKQLQSHLSDIPHNLISAITPSNEIRIKYISNTLIDLIKKNRLHYNDTENGKLVIGIYRLLMKSNSDNYRNSSSLEILKKLEKEENISIIIYEPLIKENTKLLSCNIVNNINTFKTTSDIIIANRYDSCLDDIKDKVYTRDIYNRD